MKNLNNSKKIKSSAIGRSRPASNGIKKNTVAMPKSFSHVLIRPRITEKATMLGEKNVYTFDVAKDSNKALVTLAVKALYNVTPLRVNMVTVRTKSVFIRGKKGTKGGGKKALVYLKKGDKIEFV